MINLYQEDLIPINMVKSRQSWFEYHLDPFTPRNSRYGCYYCRKYSAYFNILQPNDLASQTGVRKDSMQANYKVIEKHHRLESHKQIMNYLSEEKVTNMNIKMGKAIDTLELPHHQKTDTFHTQYCHNIATIVSLV